MVAAQILLECGFRRDLVRFSYGHTVSALIVVTFFTLFYTFKRR